MSIFCLFLLLLLPLIGAQIGNENELSDVREIIVRTDRGISYVTSLAKKFGLIEVREIPEFPQTYTLSISRVNDKHARNIDIIRQLAASDGIEFTEPLLPLSRPKRGYDQEKMRHSSFDMNKVVGISQMDPIIPPNSGASETVNLIAEQVNVQKKRIRFNDQLFLRQWYITNELINVHKSHKIMEAWGRGYSGKGMVVAILDDGLEYTHPDLYGNYNSRASYDFNNDDPDPSPRTDGDNAHGTRCAGEVAMMANNFYCGVGIAFNAQIAGIKLLDGTVTDAVEGRSLAYQHQVVDIYSASWGPADNGETVDGPKRLAQEALIRGTTYGRRGRGSLYVWASGNGGSQEDNCNCDGYASSIYTISVGSVSQNGSFPWYGEKCASTLACTFSSGSKVEGKIATTDIGSTCTNEHTGTSAAAPIAAGILALVLEANPNLTWRDIQHLIVWTSQVYPIKSNPGWKRNGVGLLYNERFGFGLLDADKLTKWAKTWTTVPPQRFCNVGLQLREPLIISTESKLRVAFNVSGCRGTVGEVNYIEHVQLQTTIEYPLRGALEIELISPFNTSSTLLSTRSKDKSNEGFKNWLFTSVHFWGEKPNGYWILEVRDKTKTLKRVGKITKLALFIFGTREKPLHMSRKRDSYPDPDENEISDDNFMYNEQK